MHTSYLRKNHRFLPRRANNQFPSGTFAPQEVAALYGFPKLKPTKPVKIGIGSLGGAVTQSDVVAACQAWGMQIPSIQLISVDGNPMQSDPGGANVENMLDVLVSHAVFFYCTGTPAQLIFAQAANDGGGIARATMALVNAGCDVISWSWGSPESMWMPADRQQTMQAFAAAVTAGITVCAASGDNSLDDGTSQPTVDYPCGDANVWAVGGTKLIAANGKIVSEMAWGDGAPGDAGGGGGTDVLTTQPLWQHGIVPGPFRGCPDSSANADPDSGYQIMADGNWQVVGGTSASSPLTAGLVAAIKSTGPVFGNMGPLLYPAQKTAFNDIVLGSDGTPAIPGWDESTGLGSPNGRGFAAALAVAGSTPTQPTKPPPVVQPPPLPPVQIDQKKLKGIVDGTLTFLTAEARSPVVATIVQAGEQMLDGQMPALWSFLNGRGLL